MTQTHFLHADVGTANDLRWAGVGTNTTPDSFAAGRDAAAEARLERDAKLFVVFASPRHDHEALLAGVASVAASDAEVVGCSTGGGISGGGPLDCDVVVLALGGRGISVATRGVEVIGGDLRTAGERVAAALWDVDDRGNSALVVLSDATSGDQQEVVRGALSAVGATVPIVGGCAGPDDDLTRPVLFHADRDGACIGSSQVVGIAISSVSPIGIGVAHGCERVGDAVTVTRSTGTIVHEIDGHPALDQYLRLHGTSPDLAEDRDAFARFAATRPIGVAGRDRDEIRLVLAADPEARTITTAAGVPQGAVVYPMSGGAESVVLATDEACDQALAPVGGRAFAMLAFDCVARRGAMGAEGVVSNVERMTVHADAPLAGFYAYGGFAPGSDGSGVHNHTLVTLAFG